MTLDGYFRGRTSEFKGRGNSRFPGQGLQAVEAPAAVTPLLSPLDALCDCELALGRTGGPTVAYTGIFTGFCPEVDFRNGQGVPRHFVASKLDISPYLAGLNSPDIYLGFRTAD